MTLPAIFVSPDSALLPTPGGVQLYTRELLECLQVAGFEVRTVPYASDQRLLSRLRRKISFSPYRHILPDTLADRTLKAAQEEQAEFIFLNGVRLGPLATQLRQEHAFTGKIVLLSYGLESVDFLHRLRVTQDARRKSREALGDQLLRESQHRAHIDHVFCLAPFEAEIERWIGAKKVDWLPRTLAHDAALEWRPQPLRIGCMSRLDHPPNVEGLTLFLEALARQVRSGLRFRLAGSPAEPGRDLAARFPFVDYLGPIGDAELAAEAASWSCFVNPLFCYSCGCSTKLAVAMAWGIPIVTTSAGTRGYTWRDGAIPVSDSPDGLATLALNISGDPESAWRVRADIQRVATSMPSIKDVAHRLRKALFSSSSV